MKHLQFTLGIVLSLALFQSCIKDDRFGLSSFNNITAFQLPMQDGTTTINADELLIEIPVGDDVDLENLVPLNIEISNLASISPSPNEPQDFTESVLYTVTAEDNTSAVWTVTVVSTLPNPQLPNSNFDAWHAVGDYQQPGESEATTIWGTANKAISIAADPNANPEDLGNGDFAVNLTSVEAPLLVRMAAATIFTGTFTDGFPSATDPRSNVDFGTPFTAKPSTFSVDYTYVPGASYEDEDGNVIPGTDQCDIYVLLEKREGDVVERIGTGWFRSDAQVDDFTTIEVDIIYGELDPSLPQFEYANIRDDEVWGNAEDTPTHITVVFSSSALGDFFTGAIGSELRANNFELIY